MFVYSVVFNVMFYVSFRLSYRVNRVFSTIVMHCGDGSITQAGYTRGIEWNGFGHIQLVGVPKISQIWEWR